MPFADLHCHPSFWTFNSKDAEAAAADAEFHIWNIQTSRKEARKRDKGKRAIYAQSDFDALTRGEVQLVFASLYPIEKGFFMGNRARGLKADLMGGILNQAFIGTPRFLRRFLGAVTWPLSRALSLLINNEGWGREILQKMVMNFSRQRINYFQSGGYHYFKALQQEYNFYRRFSGQKPLVPAPEATRPYVLVTSAAELEHTVREGRKIAVVLTIEGSHAFALEPDPDSADYLKLAAPAVIEQRIDLIKNGWKIFFVTFSHHFNNCLAGHAHSLPKLLAEITTHTTGMNTGFEPSGLGVHYIRKLLSLKADNRKDGREKRRVLIDVKHFSARSRSDFYRQIIRPYNEAHPDDKIPVIASHCGFYGHIPGTRVDLAYLAAQEDSEEDDAFSGGFYRWNINLCDEDIETIVASDGLIGLSFDQRIMGVKIARTVTAWIDVIGRQVVEMVASAADGVPEAPWRIWDCLCIGTDFDGIIDPVNTFATAAQFGAFKTELLRYLEVLYPLRGAKLFLDRPGYSPMEVVEKIAFTNAYRFTLKHYK